LKAHKLLGTYLVYLALLPLLLKVLSLFVKKGWSRALYSAGLLLFIGLTFYQAKEGGELDSNRVQQQRKRIGDMDRDRDSR